MWSDDKNHTSCKCKPRRYQLSAHFALCVQQIYCIRFELILQGSSIKGLALSALIKFSVMWHISFLCLHAWIFIIVCDSPPSSSYTIAPYECNKERERRRSPCSLCRKQSFKRTRFTSVQNGRANINPLSSIVLRLKVQNIALCCF